MGSVACVSPAEFGCWHSARRATDRAQRFGSDERRQVWRYDGNAPIGHPSASWDVHCVGRWLDICVAIIRPRWTTNAMLVPTTTGRDCYPANGEHAWPSFILTIPAVIFFFPPRNGLSDERGWGSAFWGDRARTPAQEEWRRKRQSEPGRQPRTTDKTAQPSQLPWLSMVVRQRLSRPRSLRP